VTKPSIDWTDSTGNPTTERDHVSPGCDNCYALNLARRLKAMGSEEYQQDGDPRTSRRPPRRSSKNRPGRSPSRLGCRRATVLAARESWRR
jgi:protein gp37